MIKNAPMWDVLEYLFQKPEQWDEPASTYQEVIVEIEKVSKPGTQVWHWQDLDKDKAMERGTQIIYVPMHANGSTDHPDCETGFVTSIHENGQAAFCRYWSKIEPKALRTRANSELTPISSLVVHDTVPQSQVLQALANCS